MRKSENSATTTNPNPGTYPTPKDTKTEESPRYDIQEEDDDEEMLKEEHTENIMKNNGWNGLGGFFTSQREMKESIHQGQEEPVPPRTETKLLKLGSLGKHPISLSILPEGEMI
jgi:hypothetical protein